MKILQAVLSICLLAGNTLRGLPVQDFFEHEAGIAAFFYFSEPTNLQSNLLRNQFRTILTNQTDYLIGFVPEEGFESYSILDTKVVVHHQGWAVAYFPKEYASSFVFRNTVSGALKLEKTLLKIANAMEIEAPLIQYTHCQYQEAQTMALIEVKGISSSTKSFDFRLPGTNTYYERAWYIYSIGILNSLEFTLDDRSIQKSQNSIHWDRIKSDDLVTGVKHIVRLKSGMGSGLFGMTLIYSGNADLSINFADGIRFIDLVPMPEALHAAGEDIATYDLSYVPSIQR